jgi:hypothetical protein
MEELVTEEMLWDRIPEVEGAERASTYYELSARIYARGQYDEALALAETACDIYRVKVLRKRIQRLVTTSIN